MYIQRAIMPYIKNYLDKNKIIIIYWARQVGKTTIAKEVFKWKDYRYLNGDDIRVQKLFEEQTETALSEIVKWYDYIIVDEAQRIKNIWIKLKIIHESYPEKKIIVTGSSSLDLANSVNEPLTWRKFELILHPFSVSELLQQKAVINVEDNLNQWMITWLYPDSVLNYDENLLYDLVNNYTYKDILIFDKIKKSENLIKLLKALALQIWNEVSYRELWEMANLNPKTVEQYVQILEQAFIIFRLQPYTLNERTGIKKLRKIYFRDLWIRNALINNLNPIDLRTDVWHIWENFVIVEFLKKMNNTLDHSSCYFWRDWWKEVDFLVMKGGNLYWYEIKHKSDRWKNFNYIKEQLNLTTFEVVNKSNFTSFIN